MPLRALIVAAAALGAAAAVPAHPVDPGVPVTGHFSGVARATSSDGAHPWDGATVTGRFDVRVPRGPWWDDGAAFAPPWGRLEFQLAGERFVYLAGPDHADSPGHVALGDPPGQSLSFLTHPRPRDHGAILNFVSADASLYRDDDFGGSLAIDGRTVSSMSASFADGTRRLDVVVDVDRFRFDAVSSPASEPTSLALFAAGALALAGMRRRGRRPCEAAAPVPPPVGSTA